MVLEGNLPLHPDKSIGRTVINNDTPISRASLAKSGAQSQRPGQSVWVAAMSAAILWALLLYVSQLRTPRFVILSLAASALAPLPVLLMSGRRQKRLGLEAFRASEKTEKLKLELDTVRYRTV